MARVEIISGVERRRRWSDETKLRILAEADEPGARIGDVARRHDIYPAQIRAWRHAFSSFDALTTFVPVNVVDGGGARLTDGAHGPGPSMPRPWMIEISLRNGRSLKAPADIDRRILTSLIVCVEAT